MGLVPMAIATLCYVWTAAAAVTKKDYAMALVFVAYAVANLGLMWIASRTLKP